jgi:hypothetical protein
MVDLYHRFGTTCCLHLESWRRFTLLPWKLGQQVSVKYRWLSTRLHCDTFCSAEIFMITADRNSNLGYECFIMYFVAVILCSISGLNISVATLFSKTLRLRQGERPTSTVLRYVTLIGNCIFFVCHNLGSFICGTLGVPRGAQFRNRYCNEFVRAPTWLQGDKQLNCALRQYRRPLAVHWLWTSPRP